MIASSRRVALFARVVELPHTIRKKFSRIIGKRDALFAPMVTRDMRRNLQKVL
jgi:hypothetical protein